MLQGLVDFTTWILSQMQEIHPSGKMSHDTVVVKRELVMSGREGFCASYVNNNIFSLISGHYIYVEHNENYCFQASSDLLSSVCSGGWVLKTQHRNGMRHESLQQERSIVWRKCFQQLQMKISPLRISAFIFQSANDGLQKMNSDNPCVL